MYKYQIEFANMVKKVCRDLRIPKNVMDDYISDSLEFQKSELAFTQKAIAKDIKQYIKAME